MRRTVSLFVLFFLLGMLLLPFSAAAQDAPVVRAVMFYSPTCPHCHKVIQEDLPPLADKYGQQLQILLIDVTTQGGQDLYQAAAKSVPIPGDKRGVPALVVGETLLIGDQEIPEQLPGIIEQALAADGIDWPAIPGLDRVVKDIEARATAEAASETPEAAPAPQPGQTATAPTVAPAATPATDTGASLNPVDVKSISDMSIGERLGLDPAGSAIALVTLALMLGMMLWALRYWLRTNLTLTPGPSWLNWLIPLLSVVGMGVAFYLTFVETTGAEAICGPVGDCNAVQQSSYAHLFGVLPVGLLGLLGYVAILGLWAWQRFGPEQKVEATGWMLPAATFFGVAFSAYLTFLEPFVIGAICMWCMTSAWIMLVFLFITFRWAVPRGKP